MAVAIEFTIVVSAPRDAEIEALAEARRLLGGDPEQVVVSYMGVGRQLGPGRGWRFEVTATYEKPEEF